MGDIACLALAKGGFAKRRKDVPAILGRGEGGGAVFGDAYLSFREGIPISVGEAIEALLRKVHVAVHDQGGGHLLPVPVVGFHAIEGIEIMVQGPGETFRAFESGFSKRRKGRVFGRWSHRRGILERRRLLGGGVPAFGGGVLMSRRIKLRRGLLAF